MLLYTYTAIAAPLTEALTTVIQRQMAAWGPTLDATIAELLVRALAANGADATRHLSQDHRAEVYVWRVHEGEDTPYVAVVGGAGSVRLRLCARCTTDYFRGADRPRVSA